jgi:ribosomal protein S18 acetylase RimI-like enzyme
VVHVLSFLGSNSPGNNSAGTTASIRRLVQPYAGVEYDRFFSNYLIHKHRTPFHIHSAAMGLAAGLRGVGQQQLLFLYMLRASAVNQLTQTNTAISVRLARRDDIPGIQSCNLRTLPENYATQFYVQHLHNWPQLAIVAEACIPTNDVDRSDVSGVGNQESSQNAFLPDNGMHYSHGRVNLLRQRNHLAKVGFRGGGSERKLPSSRPDQKKEVVGYVLGRMDTHPDTNRATRQGHITSLAVLPNFRRRGIAQDLMNMVHSEVC